VTVQEEQFSDQFFSASMDGTIKLWDLHSTPLPKLKEKSTMTTQFERPKNLKKYESPLNIYHNRLKPSYTVILRLKQYNIYIYIYIIDHNISLYIPMIL